MCPQLYAFFKWLLRICLILSKLTCHILFVWIFVTCVLLWFFFPHLLLEIFLDVWTCAFHTSLPNTEYCYAFSPYHYIYLWHNTLIHNTLPVTICFQFDAFLVLWPLLSCLKHLISFAYLLNLICLLFDYMCLSLAYFVQQCDRFASSKLQELLVYNIPSCN